MNSGPGNAYNVVATITCVPADVTILAGQVNLGDIPAGSFAWSTDSFVLEFDLTNPHDPNKGIIWRVEYDDEVGNHHVIEGVPKFCGEQVECP